MTQQKLTKNLLVLLLADFATDRDISLKPFKNVKDLNIASELKYFASGDLKSMVLFKRLCLFYTSVLPSLVDSQKNITSESFFVNYINNLIKINTRKSLYLVIIKAVKEISTTRVIYLYAPISFDFKAKQNLRETIGVNKFLDFKENTNLIGGAQILENSELKDYSWLTKLNLINTHAK
jgi:hypothetical protein